jgi:hypothetical protein
LFKKGISQKGEKGGKGGKEEKIKSWFIIRIVLFL